MQFHTYSILSLLLSGLQFINCETTVIISAAFKSNLITTLAASTSGPNKASTTAPHGTVSNMNTTLTANTSSVPGSVNNATSAPGSVNNAIVPSANNTTPLWISNVLTPGSDSNATAPTANNATTVPIRNVTSLSSPLVTSAACLNCNATVPPAATSHASNNTKVTPNLVTRSKTPSATETTMHAVPVSKGNSSAGATTNPSSPPSNATDTPPSLATATTTISVSFAKTTSNGITGFPTPSLWVFVLLPISFFCL